MTSIELETLANGRHYNMKYISCFSVVSHCPKVGQSRVNERQKKQTDQYPDIPRNKEYSVQTNYTYYSYNTRRCCITNIFWVLGRNNGRHNSAKYWVPDTETTKYTVHIHVWNRSEAFRAKHAMSYTGCRNLGDWCNPLQTQCTAARRLKPKRGT